MSLSAILRARDVAVDTATTASTASNMGKKSKKKGGAANKAARKEKLQERREQQLEQLDNYSNNDGGNDEIADRRRDREYFVGDRVWFFSKDINPNMYRGIVQTIDDGSLDIKPLEALIAGNENTFQIPTEYVFPDFCDMTLRFDVGDKVICYMDGYWVPATVSYLWPIGGIENQGAPLSATPEDNIVPCYKCRKVYNDEYPIISVPYDDDDCIRKRPTSFRFKVGDNITLNSEKARGNTGAAWNYLQRTTKWTEGKIIAVDIKEQDLDYAVYECTFKVASKKLSCLIDFDDDEHIALVDDNPRKRLFDAIEQDCSRDHFIYLCNHFDIDINAFRDLVLMKAIEFGSYDALTWLQQDCKIDPRNVKDKDGNNFLHMVANSSYASRFIRKLGTMHSNGYFGDMTLHLDYKTNIALNNDGEVWLQCLARRGDVKALDVALSPNGLTLTNYFFGEEMLECLSDSVKESNDPIMQNIFETFVSFRTFYEQVSDLTNTFKNEEELLQDNKSLALLVGEDKKHQTKLFTRFYRDWEEFLIEKSSLARERSIFNGLVMVGRSRLFKVLYEADSNLFDRADYIGRSKEDRQEFIQEELRESNKESDEEPLTMNIFNACILGSKSLDHFNPRSSDYENYLFELRCFFLQCSAEDCPTFYRYLLKKKEEGKRYTSNYGHIDERVRLLGNENIVEGRQDILNYLLLNSEVCPDVLFPIKHRQCWALRSLVDKKYLDLDSMAAKEGSIARNSSELSFLIAGKIPPNMTVRCCLAFAAVQYDDFQSFEWLCESCGPPDDVVGGWNLLHYSAYMGRIEIIGWLYTQSSWNSLVARTSSRKDFTGAFAVHIAAKCGHLHACELLMDLKVPLKDKKGKLPDDYAKRSQHEFVREWAAKRAKPLAFHKDVKKLLRLVEERKSACEIKKYTLSLGCLDIDTWRSFDCDTVDDKLVDISFKDVISSCCKHPDIEVARWICVRIYFSHSYRYSDRSNSKFWDQPYVPQYERKALSRDELLSVARERGFDDLADYLSGKYFKDESCRGAVMAKEHILVAALGADERIEDIRTSIVRIEVLIKILEMSKGAIGRILQEGGQVNELRELIRIESFVREAVRESEAGDVFDERHENFPVLEPFDMTTMSFREKNSTASKLLFCTVAQLRRMPAHLAIEGYADLIQFCLRNLKGWTTKMELSVMRIASFFGHSSIVEMLMSPPNDLNLLSDRDDLIKAAILGAGEALRYRDLQFYLQMPAKRVAVGRDKGVGKKLKGGTMKEYFRSDIKKKADDDELEEMEKLVEGSLTVAVLNGYIRDLYDSEVDSRTELKTLRLLIERNICTDGQIFYAMELFLQSHYHFEWVGNLFHLFDSVIDVFGIQPSLCMEQIRGICKIIAVRPDICGENDSILFLQKMIRAGVDVQELVDNDYYHYKKNNFSRELAILQERQRNDWACFDVVKKGGSLTDIQQMIKEGRLTTESRDRGGLLLTHLSAAYDRVDLLEWLVSEEMDLDALDAQRRTTLGVAKASKASSATKWIIEWKARAIIRSFVRRHYHITIYKRRLQKSKMAATIIQSAIRAYITRKIYANVLVSRMEASQHFHHIWGDVVSSADNATEMTSTSWSDIREKLIDIKVGLDEEMLDDTDERLSRAVEEAVKDDSSDGDDDAVSKDLNEFEELTLNDGVEKEATHNAVMNSQLLSFQVTSHVVKFLQQGDKKYRSFFVRRMRQLASGERSRILQKPLKGSKTIIYETYLEQKSGHRILWTEEKDTLVIWYIAKHKQVSRLMQLIDDSKSRSARQQIPSHLVDELQNEGLLTKEEHQKEVLLDIFGNVPLKIYDVNFNTINDITKESWAPQLHLTDEERDIVEAEGTVLVMGRSGSGKTVTIISSIEYDRQSSSSHDPSFSQLFIARSVRLCRYVAGAVGEDNRTSFLTYAKLLNEIESTLPGHTRSFNPSQKIDFARFKRDFHNRPSSNANSVSALILWTVIRTFLKGSIEAFQSPDGILPRDAFVEVERLGKNRCRVPAELRDYVYDEFLQYQKYLQEQKLWDACDRVRHLLLRMKKSKEVNPDAFSQVQRSKVYVDEVQDYTQLEILLFFYLSGPNSLFLAGDPAQSVVEGTEFRFEEVRGVGHFVGSTIQKPKTVNVNFRSHSGILNCAGGVLDFLFTYFPSSAKQLKKDRGLFQGSRPGVLLGTSIVQLNALLADKLKGAVILTHDDSARHWRRQLNDYKLVYGIREAKGLEFKTVILIDFFREIPTSLQKPWRELVLGRATQDFDLSHPLVATFLKLLYTGVTRCIEKLFFVETKSSIAGDASMRWLTKKVPERTSYATRNNINDVEAMSMTSDEFISEGINNAELAQAADELGEAQLLLDKSIWCFEQTDVVELAAKARIHHSSVLFRLEIEMSNEAKNENELVVIQMRAAQLIESLTKEGLLFEVLNILSSVMPFLSEYAKEELEKRFIRKVRLSVGEE